MEKTNVCEHTRLTKILGGPQYACNECGALFTVAKVKQSKEKVTK